MTENFKLVYMETRCQPVEDQWPPNQPTTIVNVALIHHEGEQIQQELIDMSMRNVSAVEKLSYRHPKSTKNIADIFRSSHKRILIEGAPGIGKTVLTKEIAYCWARDEILSHMKLFLLFIRDPDLHCVNSIKELVNYLNNDCLNDSEAEVAVEELRKSKGSGIVFVLDGYDECPSDSELKTFVDKLVQKKLLQECMVVITSRPTASLLLRQLVDQRIEILGLAKKEQKQYISESLKGSPEMIIKLQEYLKQQPIINSLIYVPLHLAILLYLFKQGSLPETLTEMNEYFIIHTIYRELARHGQSFGLEVKKLSHLPPGVLNTICQLSKLAFRGLNKNQLVFTFVEVTEVCPEVGITPVAINGLGLLQAVHHYCQKGAGKTTSLNFLHFTMQEYLAALHVTTLPNEKQLSMINHTFWDEKFNFMWIMYVGIVGTKSINSINSLYQPDASHSHEHNVFARKCLFIFQCYLELKKVYLIPKVISSMFSNGNINLSGQALLPHHITSLTVFMTRSTTQCISLNLNDCYIGCDGMSILANYFSNFQEKILSLKKLSLRHNSLSSLWGPLTEKHNDEITNSGLLQSVESLDLSYNPFCDSGAAEMFTAWKNFQTSNEIVNVVLQDLNISGNMISDVGAVTISDYLRNNNTLKILNVSRNWFSKEGIMSIVKACTINKTLHKLVCTLNNISKSGLAEINEYIREENAVQMFDASWNTIAKTTQYGWDKKYYKLFIKTTYQLLDMQKQSLQSDNDDIVEHLWYINEITELKYRMKFLQISFECFFNVGSVDLQSTTLSNFEVEILTDCLKTNNKLIELNISNCLTEDSLVLTFSSCLMTNRTLCKLNLSNNKITDKGTKELAEAIKVNRTLQELNISKNNISDEGAKRFAEAIQVNTTLQELNISKNWISKEGVMRIVEACTINRTLHKLVCTHNNLSKSGLADINKYIREKNALQVFDASYHCITKRKQWDNNNYRLFIETTYQLLDIQKQNLQSHNDDILEDLWHINEITELKYRVKFLQSSFECFFNVDSVDLQSTTLSNFEVEILTDCLKTNNKLIELNISNCLTEDSLVLTFSSCLMTNRTLCKLNLSNNKITDKGTKELAEAIEVNRTLQELNISKNNITDDGTKRLAETIKVNTTLQELNISINNISDEGAKRFAEAIQVNTKLQELNISKNWISKEGVMRIVEACTINRTLHKLVCTHNNLSKSGLADINEYIREKNAVQVFDASYHCIAKRKKYKQGNSYRLFIKTTYQLLDVQKQTLQSDNDDIVEDLWHINEITELKYRMKFLQISFESFFNVDSIDLQSTTLSNFEVEILTDCLKTNNKLIELNISNCLTEDSLVLTFSFCLMTNRTLCKLNLSSNKITDKGTKELAEAIQVNRTLQELNMSKNNITDEGAKRLAEAIQVNRALQELNISKNWISKEGVMRIVEACTINRTLHKLVCTHNNLSKSGLADINEYIREENAVQMFDASWNTIAKRKKCEWNNNCRLFIKTTYQLLDIQKQILQSDNDDIVEDLWHINEITELKYRMKFLQISFECFFNVDIVDLQSTTLSNFEVEILTDCLKTNNTLIELNISSCLTGDSLVLIFSSCLMTNRNLCKLNLFNNKITDKGTKELIEAIQVNTALQELNLSKNNITDEGTKGLAEAIQVNTALQELNISKNWISKEGVMRVVEACTINRTLHKLVCTHNNLSKSELADINDYIREENAVQMFDASWNSIAKRKQYEWSNNYKLFIKTTYQLLDVQKQTLQSDNNDILEDLWHINEITELKYKIKFLQNSFECFFTVDSVDLQSTTLSNFEVKILTDCLKTNNRLTELNISNCLTEDSSVLTISSCLMTNKTLRKLNLSSNKITDKGTKELAEAIKVNTTLQEVNISKNNITDEGIKKFTEAIQGNIALQELNISKNNITDEGVKKFAEAIQVNTILQKLNISKNWISKEGVMRIVEACTISRTLQKLVCTRNNLSKSGLADINEYIREENALQMFDASWNSITKRKENEWDNNYTLFVRTTYQLLDIQKQTLQSDNDDILEDLWPINEITELEYRMKFLQIGFECFSNVDIIDLQSTTLSNFEVKILTDCLKTNNRLTELDISNCLTEDSSVLTISSCLMTNKTLRKLNLSSNKITDKGTKELAEAIQVNTTLQELNISKNNITDEGARRLTDAIQVNTTLQELNISKNWIGKEGVMSIVKACTINRTLHKLVCTHNNLSKSGLADINEYIREENAVQMFDASWNSIAKGKKYEWDNNYRLFIRTTFQLLDIQKQTLQSDNHDILEDLWHINEITELKYRMKFLQISGFECFFNVGSIDLQSTTLSICEVEILTDCLKTNNKLIELNISNCLTEYSSVLTFSFCLMTNRTLRKLNLSSNKITDKGTKKLTETMKVNKTLQELNISNNNITDEGAKRLAEVIQVNTTLRDLNISINNITDEGATRLSEAIQVNTTLQELNISKNWISKEGIMRIVEACAINKTLHKLVCTHNNISKSGLAAINEYIREKNAVQVFDASWNIIAEKDEHYKLFIKTTYQLLDIQKQTLQSDNDDIVEDLWHINEITELKYRMKFLQISFEYFFNVGSIDLQSTTLSNFEVEILTDCLKTNNTLIEVNISNCLTEDLSVLTFFSYLMTNRTLCKLNMSSNKIADKGTIKLTEAIQVNTTLQKLNISKNNITYEGAKAIGEAVLVNTTLQELNISINNITDEGAKRLAEAIQMNTTLQELNISKNNITDEGAKRLAEAIQVNATLEELNISKNWISKEGVMRIVEACSINRTLHKLVCTHNNLSKSGLADINEYIREENALQVFDASWNTIAKRYDNYKLFIKTTYQLLDIQKQTLQSDNDDIVEDLWHINEITELKYRIKFLQISFKCFFNVDSVDLQMTTLSNFEVKVLTDCLKTNNRLIELNISNCLTEDSAVLMISFCLMTNRTLCKLNLSSNKITDKGTNELAGAIEVNTMLQELNISINNITDEGAKRLAEAIKVNTTLQELRISKNWISKVGVMRIVEACTINRTLHKLVCTHNNLSKCGLADIIEYIREENAVQTFDASWNIVTKIRQWDNNYKLFIRTTFQLLDIQKQTLQSDNDDIVEHLWCIYEITELKYRIKFLQISFECIFNVDSVDLQSTTLSNFEVKVLTDCLKTNNRLIELNISNCLTEDSAMLMFSSCLMTNRTLCKLNLSSNKITDKTIKKLTEAIQVNTTLQELNISTNNITDEGAMRLAEAIQVNTTIQELNISKNNVTDEGAKRLAEVFQVNTTLQELNISNNWISKEGIMRIVEACTINRTLHKLVCTHNNLSKSGLADINEYIREENALQVFDASWNSIAKGKKYEWGNNYRLFIKTTYQLLDIQKQTLQSDNDDIVEDLWNINEITELKYRMKFLQIGFECFSNVDIIDLQSTTLSNYEVEILTDCLKTNNRLIELNISNCQTEDSSVLTISSCLMTNRTLCKLNLSSNKITDKGTNKLAEAIQVNTMLQELNISKNNITDEGAKRLAEVIQMNTTLEELNISINNITDEGVKRLAKAIQVNTKFTRAKHIKK